MAAKGEGHPSKGGMQGGWRQAGPLSQGQPGRGPQLEWRLEQVHGQQLAPGLWLRLGLQLWLALWLRLELQLWLLLSLRL